MGSGAPPSQPGDAFTNLAAPQTLSFRGSIAQACLIIKHRPLATNSVFGPCPLSGDQEMGLKALPL